MLSLPKEKKWLIYCSQKGSAGGLGGLGGGLGGRHGGGAGGLETQPEPYIEKVNALAMVSRL